MEQQRTVGSEQALWVATDQVNLAWRQGVVRKHYKWFQCQRLANWSWSYQMPGNSNLRNCFVAYCPDTPSRTLGYRVFVNNKHNKLTRQIPWRKIQQNLTHRSPLHFLIAMEPKITVFTSLQLDQTGRHINVIQVLTSLFSSCLHKVS